MQKCSHVRTPRLSRRLPAVRLGYVTETHLTERACKDAVYGLGNKELIITISVRICIWLQHLQNLFHHLYTNWLHGLDKCRWESLTFIMLFLLVLMKLGDSWARKTVLNQSVCLEIFLSINEVDMNWNKWNESYFELWIKRWKCTWSSQ